MLVSSAVRVEKRVATEVPPNLVHIVLLRVKFLPETRRIDVLIALKPPPVNHLCYRRIVVGTLEPGDVWNTSCRLSPRRCCRNRVEIFVFLVGSAALRLRRLGGVIEDSGPLGAQRLVDSEKVEVIMLKLKIQTSVH